MFLKLKNHFKKLFADLKPMTFRQRVDHIWTYYKEVFFTAGIVLLLVLAMISSIVNLGVETLYYGLLGNVSCSAEGYKYMTEDFYEELGGEGKQEVVLDSAAFEDAALAEDVEANYNASMRVIAMVSGNILDYMIMDKYTMEFYIADDFFTDLREVFTEEELAALEGNLIYAQPERVNEPFPAVIRITDMPFVQEHIHVKDEIYLAFIVTSENAENNIKFWNWLEAWKPDEQ